MRSSNSRVRARAWQILGPAAFVSITLVSAQQPTLSAKSDGPQSAAPLERLVLIDAAHGGSETGAMLNPAVPEKDVNLAFARRLRQQLANHGVLAQLLRDGDATLTDDQRAAMVNAQRPTLYLSIHSTSLGSGLTVITSLLPASTSTRGLFLAWQTAQSSWLPQSRLVSTLLTPSVQRWGLPARTVLAPLRPLNNITAPALGLEISPTNGNILQLASIEYQQLISTAVSNALVSTISVLPLRPGTSP